MGITRRARRACAVRYGHMDDDDIFGRNQDDLDEDETGEFGIDENEL